MPDPNIQQIYCKAPSESDLESDLLDQGLASKDEKGNVQPKIGVTTWTPLVQEDDPSTETDESQEASYILAVVGWTENSMQHAGLTQEQVDALLAAGTLANGTEIGVDVSSLSLAPSEPKLTTYGT